MKIFAKLTNEGGCIVSTADCGELEISEAKARGDFFATGDGCGYVRRLPEWLIKHSRYARGADAECCETKNSNDLLKNKIIDAAIAVTTDDRLPAYRVFTLNSDLKTAVSEYQEAL